MFLQGGDFSSGLITNNGEIVLDSANSQISGGLLTNNGIIRGGAVIANPVQNNAVGQIIVEGPVNAQFQNDLINNGELRILAGSVAEFSGDVTGSGAFTGAGTKIFKPASIATLGPLDTPGHTVVEAGATLNATRIREQSLNVNGNVRISPAGTNNGTSRLNSLTISGSGQLDLSDNDLVIDYSGASPIGQIAQHVVTGRAGGNWNGSGITSSAAAAQAAHATTLGVLESAEFIALTGASEFFWPTHRHLCGACQIHLVWRQRLQWHRQLRRLRTHRRRVQHNGPAGSTATSI